MVSFSIVSDCPVNTEEIGLGSHSILEGSTTVIIRGPGIDFINTYLYVSVCRHVHVSRCLWRPEEDIKPWR